MIRNTSTSRLIASKNGDAEELTKLALSLTDRLLKDIIPAIANAMDIDATEKSKTKYLLTLVKEKVEKEEENYKLNILDFVENLRVNLKDE